MTILAQNDGPGRSGSSPAETPDRHPDPVREGLVLLEQLNRARTPDGRRFSELVKVRGFEPWWFHQETLLWGLLVPYLRHPAAMTGLLAGRLDHGKSQAPEVRTVARLLSSELGLPYRQRQSTSLPLSISRLGLALTGLAGTAWFRLQRRTTLLYIFDQVTPGRDRDFRMAPLYHELTRRGYRWGEAVHVRGARRFYRDAWRNLVRRRRPVILLEPLVDLCRLGQSPTRGFDPPEVVLDGDVPTSRQAFLRLLARWSLFRARESAAEIAVLRRLVRFLKIRHAVFPDDSRHANELVAACKLEGVPTLGVMHGLFNRYHPALMANGIEAPERHGFDLYGVWSEYFRERLLAGDLYDPENTVATGPLRSPTADELSRARRARSVPTAGGSVPVRVLLISEPRAPQHEVLGYVRALLADRRIRVAIKVRPGETAPRLLAALGSSAQLEVVATGTVYQALAEADVVVGTYSSVLYEAALIPLPTVVLDTTFSYGHELPDDGLAERARSPEVVVEVVLRAAELDAAELNRRRKVLWEGASPDGACRLFDLAEKRLWPPPRAAR